MRPNNSAERRSYPRTIPHTLTYIELGADNGGIVQNVSEGGLSLAVSGFLSDDPRLHMRFRFPGSKEWIEMPGEIVWISVSKKEAGVKFVNLAEGDRDRIKNWISLETSQDQLEKSAYKIPELRHDPPNASVGIDPRFVGPSPATIKNAVPDRPEPSASPVNSPHAPSYARVRAQAFITAAPIEGSLEETQLLSTKKSANRRMLTDGQLRVRLASISLLSLVVVISYILGAAAGRRGWSEFLGIGGTRNGPGKKATMEQQNRTASTPPANLTRSAPILRAENSPVRVPQITPKATSNIPIVPPQRRIEIPRGSATVPALREHDVAVPSVPIPERKNEIPTPATEAARTPPPVAKPPETSPTELATTSTPTVKLLENSASPTGSIEIIPDLYPTIRAPSESKARASRQGTSLVIGHLVTRVDPVYPPEALRQRIAGTVKLHVLITRVGTVEKVELTDGPALLAEAALRAVQQWKYQPTFIGGETIEAEEDITIVFRLTNPTVPAN